MPAASRLLSHQFQIIGICVLLLVPGAEAASSPVAHAGAGQLDEVIVTAQRRGQSKQDLAGNIRQLDDEAIQAVSHQHVHELLNQVPGVWVVRGSGQEHLTAIRSPVLSGAGSCGGFLFLEDGIPNRPAGFCNVNQLMEIHTEQASSVEVIRGPANALFGSNALHGVVNFLMPVPGFSHSPLFSIEAGANDFVRARAALPFDREAPWHASVLYASDGGFREDSAYRQAKAHLKHRGTFAGGELLLALTATSLDQDTAGFVGGKDAYKDPVLRLQNPNPDAFREAESQRLYGIWTRSFDQFDLDIRPYLRHTDMRFNHHFAPGQALEENGHVSVGAMVTASFGTPRHQLITGVDVEWSDVYLRESQAEPARGSPMVVATRPVGKHYDYEVTAASLAMYVQSQSQLTERLQLSAGVRLETTRYDYRNRMLSGNTRDDGTACGFGGCLFSRPFDRSDSFTNLAPKLSASYRLQPGINLFASLLRGFRAPQMTELYRLQNGQLVSDLDSERMDSLEAGIRTTRDRWSGELVMFSMRKRDSVFRDAEGFNVSGARSRHRGVEASLNWQMSQAWRLAVDASYARHSYDFNFNPGRGEVITAGRDMDSAPRSLGSAALYYQASSRLAFNLQWAHTGGYFLDAQNRYRYPGHEIVNLITHIEISPDYQLYFRLKNLADRYIADRADFAFNDYRYLPGQGRGMFVELRYSPD